MELTARKKQILKIVVESYIDTAEPLGSKAIAERMPVDDEALAGAKKGHVTMFKTEKPVFETALAAAKLLGLA